MSTWEAELLSGSWQTLRLPATMLPSPTLPVLGGQEIRSGRSVSENITQAKKYSIPLTSAQTFRDSKGKCWVGTYHRQYQTTGTCIQKHLIKSHSPTVTPRRLFFRGAIPLPIINRVGIRYNKEEHKLFKASGF